MPVKIAMIGAGSIGFTRRLMRDILAVPELADTVFAFTDISERNLDMVTPAVPPRHRGQRRARQARLHHGPPRGHRRRRLRHLHDPPGRAGGVPARHRHPAEVRRRPVRGRHALRRRHHVRPAHDPALLDFCKDIREVAKPDALFLNYSNPMAMNTWACNKYGGVKTIGLCHGVQGAHWQITRCIELWAKQEGLIGPDETLHRREVDVICAGLNHQTWFIKVQWRGMDMAPRLLELFEAHPEYSQTEKVRIDVLRRFGYYSTESNGHLSEYVPWYRKRTERDHAVDRPLIVDQRRDGRLSARLHRGPQLVRDRLPATGCRSRRSISAPTSAARSTAPTSSRRWRPAGPIAATSTWSTRATSPTCPTAAWSRSPATWTRTASTCRWWAICRWRAPRPARPSGARAGDGHGGGRARRRDAAQAGHAARSADRPRSATPRRSGR